MQLRSLSGVFFQNYLAQSASSRPYDKVAPRSFNDSDQHDMQAVYAENSLDLSEQDQKPEIASRCPGKACDHSGKALFGKIRFVFSTLGKPQGRGRSERPDALQEPFSQRKVVQSQDSGQQQPDCSRLLGWSARVSESARSSEPKRCPTACGLPVRCRLAGRLLVCALGHSLRCRFCRPDGRGFGGRPKLRS